MLFYSMDSVRLGLNAKYIELTEWRQLDLARDHTKCLVFSTVDSRPKLPFNPSNAEATFIQNTKTQRFLQTI